MIAVGHPAARQAARPEVWSDYLRRLRATIKSQVGADVPAVDQPLVELATRYWRGRSRSKAAHVHAEAAEVTSCGMMRATTGGGG